MSFVKHLETTTERGSGRTTMLAMHYVQLALDNFGEEVLVTDHYYTAQADRNLFVLVCNVLSALRVEFVSSHERQVVQVTGRPRVVQPYPSVSQCLDAAWREKREEQIHRNPSKRKLIR